jgi:hypothetical protein
LIEETAQWLGEGVCEVAAAIGPLRCNDPAALSMAGYILLVATIMLCVWLVIVRPRAE